MSLPTGWDRLNGVITKKEPEVIWQDSDIAVLLKGPGWIVAMSRDIEQNKLLRSIIQARGFNDVQAIVSSGKFEHLCHYVYLKFGENKEYSLSTSVHHEFGLAHRLDVDTSGALLMGKSLAGFSHLRDAFTSHEVFKEYICMVHGAVQQDRGEINSPILWDEKSNVSFISDRGQWAKSLYTVLGRYRLRGGRKIFSLCRVVIVTGRTHQIRIHMASIDHPLVGDTKYNPSQANTDFLWCPRMFLHAWRVGFCDLSRTYQEVRAPLTEDLTRSLRTLEEVQLDTLGTDAPSLRVKDANGLTALTAAAQRVEAAGSPTAAPDKGAPRAVEGSPQARKPATAAAPRPAPPPPPVKANPPTRVETAEQGRLKTLMAQCIEMVKKALRTLPRCQAPASQLEALPEVAACLRQMGPGRPALLQLLSSRPQTFAFLQGGDLETLVALQHAKGKASRWGNNMGMCEADCLRLVEMGFNRQRAMQALMANHGDLLEAMDQLASTLDTPMPPASEEGAEAGARQPAAVPSPEEQEEETGEAEELDEELRRVLELSKKEEAERQRSRALHSEEAFAKACKASLQQAERALSFEKEEEEEDEPELREALAHSLALAEEEKRRNQMEEEELERALKENYELFLVAGAAASEEELLQSLMHPELIAGLDYALPADGAAEEKERQLQRTIQQRYNEVEEEDAELDAFMASSSASLWLAEGLESKRGGGSDGGLETKRSSSDVTSAEPRPEDVRPADLRPAAGALKDWWSERFRELELSYDGEAMWMALSEMEDEQLCDWEAVKMWLGFEPEQPLPSGVVLLVSELKTQRSRMTDGGSRCGCGVGLRV